MIVNKSSKKIVASIILALILCLAVFSTGCNKEAAIPEASLNTEATPSPEANVTPEPQNYGSFTVIIPDNGKYGIATENDLVKQRILDDIVKEKGIYVDPQILTLQHSDYLNQINAVISSGQSVECIIDDYSMFRTYIDVPGLVVPIDSLLVEQGQGLLNSISSEVWNAVTYNDMICAVPGAALKEKTAMYVRKDVLDMMGLNQIVTRQEFDASLIAFSTLIPMSITPLAVNYEQALDYMTYLRGVPSNDYLYLNGTYLLREQQRYFPEFLDMLRDYYAKGYIPQDFFDLTKADVSTMFTSGLAMMYITEYTNVAEEFGKLLAVRADADVALVTKPTSRRMAFVELSGESPVSDVCVFTSNGQNHRALMVYLDWLLSDVENYETANLGILGSQINFNNLDHEYQLLGDYEQKTDFYNGLYGFGISHDAVYPPVVPINGGSTVMKCLQLQFDSYQHLSTASMVDEGTYPLNEEAQSAYSYYRFSMDEAIRKYVKGEISYGDYLQYYENNKHNAKVVTDYLATLEPNGTRK